MSVVFFVRTSRIIVPAHTTLVALVCSNSTPFRASIASLTTATAAAGPRQHHPDNERALADLPSGVHETEPQEHPANPA